MPEPRWRRCARRGSPIGWRSASSTESEDEPLIELPQPGDVVGGFRVGERLHAGGMGVLYAVSGRDPGFPLLMKVPRLGPGEPGEAVLTYEMEQTVLGAL